MISASQVAAHRELTYPAAGGDQRVVFHFPPSKERTTDINALPKTTYTYSSNALGGGQTVTFPVALNIRASDYDQVVVVLRVHDFVAGTGAEVQAAVHNSAQTAEDPGKTFRAATPLASATVVWSATVAPALGIGGASANVGEALDVLLTVKQATTAVNISLTVSVDIVLKRA